MKSAISLLDQSLWFRCWVDQDEAEHQWEHLSPDGKSTREKPTFGQAVYDNFRGFVGMIAFAVIGGICLLQTVTRDSGRVESLLFGLGFLGFAAAMGYSFSRLFRD